MKLRAVPHILRPFYDISHSLDLLCAKPPKPSHLWVLLGSSGLHGAWHHAPSWTSSPRPFLSPSLSFSHPGVSSNTPNTLTPPGLVHRLFLRSRAFSPQEVQQLLLTVQSCTAWWHFSRQQTTLWSHKIIMELRNSYRSHCDVIAQCITHMSVVMVV